MSANDRVITWLAANPGVRSLRAVADQHGRVTISISTEHTMPATGRARHGWTAMSEPMQPDEIAGRGGMGAIADALLDRFPGLEQAATFREVRWTKRKARPTSAG